MREKVHLDEAEGPLPDDAGAAQNPDMEKSNPPLSSLEMAFLEDVQDHPDSGVAARYKRLGLSARQGQKLKFKMAEQGLIAERLETTVVGRLAVIELSEKGKETLSQAHQSA